MKLEWYGRVEERDIGFAWFGELDRAEAGRRREKGCDGGEFYGERLKQAQADEGLEAEEPVL